jgi:hypothetical protein
MENVPLFSKSFLLNGMIYSEQKQIIPLFSKYCYPLEVF